jgi:ankyrin repeat protein
MKTPSSSAPSPISQEALDSLLITAAENPLGEVRDENGLTQTVPELLDRGANVDAATTDGTTALMVAAKNGDTEIVVLLLDRGAAVDAATPDGSTALMVAALNGHTGIVDKLLAQGADVDAAKTDGVTALMLVAYHGHTEIVAKLLVQGAAVDAAITDGVTALMLAAQNGHTDIVAKLLVQGAAVDAATTTDGFTALMSAAQNGHAKTVAELLDRGAAVNAATTDGFTALMLAAQNGHTDIVAKLLVQGAAVDAATTDGFTALMLAAQNGHTDIVDKLLDEGAYVNAITSDGYTALRIAAKKGHTEITSTLLKTLSKTTDEEVRRHVAQEVISMARNPATKKVFATEETKTALIEILSKTTDERVKDGLRPLIKDITVLIPELKLEAAIESYKTINPDQSVPRPRAIKTLLDRFLKEKIGQRGESQQEPIEETLEKIANSTKPVLEAFVQKPNYLKWADEIAKAYALDGCVNQPVRGWLEISAWLSIAQAPEIIDKIEASKHLRVLDKMDNYVTKKLAKEANSRMAGVEVEAGNALFREVHKKLLSNKDISEPWPGVPNSIAYERTITTWLTKGRIEEAYEEAKATLRQSPKEVANYLARSHHSGTWGLVAFPKELEEIDKKYVEEIEKMESLSGNSAEGSEKMTSLAKEKEDTVIKAIIDLSEAPFKDKSNGSQAEVVTQQPRGIPSSPSSESLSGNEVSKEGKGGSGCVIS